MERTGVAGIVRPVDTAQVRDHVVQSQGAISIRGAGYSMGGQIVAPGSLHIDMRGMDRLLSLDPGRRRVRVQAGMRWRDLQERIDPHDLSVAIMQSYSNFSVGGSVSVNCHGRYVGAGPIAHSVRALQLVTADGSVLELDRERHAALFAAAIGGYGGLGVVTEVELELAANHAIAREAGFVALDDYPDFFRAHVLGDPDAVLHNADLAPPAFDRPLAITWRRTDEAPTVADRLVPRGLDYSREQNLIWLVSEFPASTGLRERYLTDRLLGERMVVMRNYEASLDAASLEPRTRALSTYLLQEYFVPVAAFGGFARAMARILREHEVNALNVSIRHSPADRDSLLKWAPAPVFSFVLYYKQRTSDRADRDSRRWTRRLVDAALAAGGRYYLPYRLHASRGQFERAYPEAAAFAAIKRDVDPGHRFRNRLWDRYLRTDGSG